MQVLCFWRFNKPTHPVILSCFIKIRQSAIHSSKQSTYKLSVNDKCHLKPENSNVQPTPKDTPQKLQNSRDHTAKPIVIQPSHDHPSPITHTQDYFWPFQDHKQPIAPFQDHKLSTNPISQDHLTTTDVRDIIVLKNDFPNSFDTTGNMPGQYTVNSTYNEKKIVYGDFALL